MITEYGYEIDPQRSRGTQIIERFRDMNISDLVAIESEARSKGDIFIADEARGEINHRNRIEIPWVYDDGGRSAYFKGENAGDCVVRSLAIVLERDYKEVYDRLAELQKLHTRNGKRSARDGVSKNVYKRYIGFETDLEWHPLMGIGTGCTVHVRPDELPTGRLLLSCSRHLTAMIDGVLHDTYDCSRDGTRCVYGYWKA